MSSDNSLLNLVFAHRQGLHSTIDAVLNKPDAASANQLKEQLLSTSKWLWQLSPCNAELVRSLSLYHPAAYSDLANRAFTSAVLSRELCHHLNWHGISAKALITCALTMDIGLAITVPVLAQHQPKGNKLTKQQLQHYRNHPLTSASFLHKYKIINKTNLKYVIEHQELLNGRGFPKGLRQHQIVTPTRILSVVAKFSELINQGHHQSGINIRQILSLLAQSEALYCPKLTRLLATIVNQPSPTMIINLSGQQQGIIHKIDKEKDSLSVIELITNDQQQLVIGHKVQQLKLSSVGQLSIINELYHETIFAQHWADIQHQAVADHSNSAARLRPEPALAQLLHQLISAPTDKQQVDDLISQQTALGKQLVSQLSKQYPKRQFNSSFHAVKMAGFEHSNGLISQLGLMEQLNNYDFPARATLSAKIHCVLALCRQASSFTNTILPNQAAMFALINLAPLYFERTIIEMGSRQEINLNDLAICNGYSLMALSPTNQQAKISASLAQHWDNKKLTHQALTLLNSSAIQLTKNQSNNEKPSQKQAEIINIFKLVLCLTHHIFHGIALDDPIMKIQLKPLVRTMKLVNQDIKQLINSALEQGPYCAL